MTVSAPSRPTTTNHPQTVIRPNGPFERAVRADNARAFEHHREQLQRTLVLAVALHRWGQPTTGELIRQLGVADEPEHYAWLRTTLNTSAYVTRTGEAGPMGNYWALTRKGERLLLEMPHYQLMRERERLVNNQTNTGNTGNGGHNND